MVFRKRAPSKSRNRSGILARQGPRDGRGVMISCLYDEPPCISSLAQRGHVCQVLLTCARTLACVASRSPTDA
eukprot:7455752-Lingulodinium_polyedra.AAC.1